ncbi:MAG: hypothetical protein ACYC2H_08475 [Thermoplasmatota archaeon]
MPEPPRRRTPWTQGAWAVAALGIASVLLFIAGVGLPVFAVVIGAGLIGASLAAVALVHGEPRARARFVLGFNLFIGAMPFLLWGLVLLVEWLLGAGEPCESC